MVEGGRVSRGDVVLLLLLLKLKRKWQGIIVAYLLVGGQRGESVWGEMCWGGPGGEGTWS